MLDRPTYMYQSNYTTKLNSRLLTWGDVKHLDFSLKIQDFTDLLSYKCSCILTLNCNITNLSILFWMVMLYFFYFLDTIWSFYPVYIIFMSLENVKMMSSCKK